MICITTAEIIPNSYAGTDHKTRFSLFSLLAGIVFVVLLDMN